MTADAIGTHLQSAALILAAVYNGILAYEIRDNAWRMIGSVVTALLLAMIAYDHYSP
jgi:hypothetical protein